MSSGAPTEGPRLDIILNINFDKIRETILFLFSQIPLEVFEINTPRGIYKSASNISLKYFSENHMMVKFEINTPISNKILLSVLTKYSSRRREYLVRTRGSILLLRGVFIKIFIEWW